MKTKIKTKEELEIMKQGGAFLGQILKELLEKTRVGTIPLDLDLLAQKRMKEMGTKPSFMTVSGYKWATCISVNEGVVHGIPTKVPFKAGDVVSIDVGLIHKGFHTDTSWSVYLPHPDGPKPEISTFLAVGEKALHEAIKVAHAGNHIGHISQVIQDHVEKAGYQVVRGLVGHAIGRELHENPQIPGILTRPPEKTPLLEENMTFAIEVIYSMGSSEIVHANEDGWTLATADGSLAGLFEATVAIERDKAVVLTRA